MVPAALVDCLGCGDRCAPEWCDECCAPPAPPIERCRHCRDILPVSHDDFDNVCDSDPCQQRLRLEDGADSLLHFQGR